MPLPNAYLDTSRFSEWSEKDKQEYWDRKEQRKKEAKDKRYSQKSDKNCADSTMFGLSDNDGW